jgi:hypothetical protein
VNTIKDTFLVAHGDEVFLIDEATNKTYVHIKVLGFERSKETQFVRLEVSSLVKDKQDD